MKYVKKIYIQNVRQIKDIELIKYSSLNKIIKNNNYYNDCNHDNFHKYHNLFNSGLLNSLTRLKN